MAKLYSVALAFPHEHDTVRGLYKGILEYAQDFPQFTFRHTGPNDLNGVMQLESWRGDGAIASLNSEAALKIADSLNCPVVNISGALEKTRHPRVAKDHYEVGQAAAEHLASTGVSTFGYIGIRNRWYSQSKRDGFQDFLRKSGYSIHEKFIDKITDLNDEERAFISLKKWFGDLPFPIGILLDTDAIYGLVCDLCKERQLSIPNDVTIVGVNNFSAICLTRTPTLTSIENGDTRYGYTALETLHKLMAHSGAKVTEEVVVKGYQLFARDSTDITFVENPKLNDAIKFIRANLSKSFSMDDVTSMADCSRRWLENAFKAHLNTTPATFIQSLRIKKAKQLVMDYPKMETHEIARNCGFSSKRHMDDVFRKVEKTDLEDFHSRNL
jgi:LacI family transcriptional regulator